MKFQRYLYRLAAIVCLLCLFGGNLAAQVPFPGTVIAQSPAPLTNSYASPSIVILPDRSYVASHDISGTITAIYRSADSGAHWSFVALVSDSHWATLFVHNNILYLMGVAKSFGNIVIHKSLDGGYSWTKPDDANTGLLVSGRFHTAPVPVVRHNGRIWRAYEESPDPDNERDFHAFVMSAPEDADLLKASSWTRTNTVALNPAWLNADIPEWCEGNVVVTPDGKIVDFIRLKTDQAVNGTLEMQGPAAGIPRYEVGAKIEISDDGQTAAFNTSTGFVHFPGAMTKFTIRYDPVSGKYWSLVNKITTVFSGWGNGSSNAPWNQRNVLMLSSSSDLLNWEERYKIIRWNEGEIITRRANFGFQYADWQFDGNDIVAAVRTSWYGADWHDANTITFHRLTDFRNLTMADSPADIGPLTQSPGNILSWQFGVPQATGSETLVNSTETNPGLNVSVLSRGSGLNAAGFVRSFNSTCGTQHNSKDNAIARNEYLQFEVQAKSGYSVSLATIDAKLSRTSAGAKSYQWAYSKDGVNFTDIGTGPVFNLTDTDGEGVVQSAIHLEMYKDLQNVPSPVKITFRMYIWGSTSLSGRFSVGRYTSGDTTPSLVVGGAVVPTPVKETPLAGWTLSAITGNTTGSLNAEVNSGNLLSSTLSRGGGLTAAALNYGYYSTLNPGNSSAEAIANNAYYTFSIQPASGHYVSLSRLEAKLRRNSAGPVIYRWYYSKDGVNFAPIGDTGDVPFLSTENNGLVQAPVDLSSIAEMQHVASTQSITFRLYTWGAATSSGGFGFARYTADDDYCLAVYGTTSDDIVTGWKFDTGINGKEVSSNATTVNAGIEQPVLTRGNHVAATEGSTVSFVGNFPVMATKSAAIADGNYFQFVLKAKPGFAVSLTSLDARIRIQENAPHHYCWRYSLDGTTFSDLGPADITAATTVNNGEAQPQINLSAYTDLQNVSSDKSITIRLYAWGGTATTSNSFGIGKSLSGANALVIGGTVTNALPVTLLSFTGRPEGKRVRLDWTTASEQNNSHFEVLRSKDGQQFYALGTVGGRGTTTNLSKYNYVDNDPGTGINYYRLKQVDLNASISLSDIVPVKMDLVDYSFKIHAAAGDTLTSFFINSPYTQHAVISITDLTGRQLAGQPVILQQGSTVFRWNLLLSAGVYIARLVPINEKALTVKFVK
ncbi:hypothetical protein FW774_11885 [Pedobacter sp. BS3]|uniref:hypothetical protein n=1 Tax=Pedobacter sp. BS3 TaxID=2567937 RepID=UPI0011EEB7D7|nr:hypothetical protein [Pedobacter sp. BS3]TZF82998.1 hypothetical protein FW774_11885 [Pedobacter sp. BS3]